MSSFLPFATIYIYIGFFFKKIEKQIEKSIAKKDTIYTRQKDRGKTNLRQSKPKTFPRDITTQRWLTTPSNLSTIT